MHGHDTARPELEVLGLKQLASQVGQKTSQIEQLLAQLAHCEHFLSMVEVIGWGSINETLASIRRAIADRANANSATLQKVRSHLAQ